MWVREDEGRSDVPIRMPAEGTRCAQGRAPGRAGRRAVMKKEVCFVLCALGLAACGRGTETPRTPEMRTQQPTEAWSMPETDRGGDAPGYGPGTSAPGSFDREPPSSNGTGDEGLIVPSDPAGGSGSGSDTMGSPDASGVQRPGNTNTQPGIPGNDSTSSPGVPGSNNTAPGGAVRPGQNPGAAPGTPPGLVPGGGTSPGGSTNPDGGTR
jgi:hypothetical protein